MEGAAVAGGVLQRARASLRAGCDLLLICNRPDLVDQLLGELRWRKPAGWRERVAPLFLR
jgi:beta-N-acetylhexosaminidase